MTRTACSRTPQNTLLALALVPLLLTAALTAHAQVLRHPALHWSRAASAEDCIDPQRLAQRVEVITGPVFVSAASADSSIEAHVERVASGTLRVRITTGLAGAGARGLRTLSFQAAHCREIDDAVALVIAVSIDPALGTQGLPSEVLSVVETEEAPEAALLAELREVPGGPALAQAAPTAGIASAPKSLPLPVATSELWQFDAEVGLALGTAPKLAAGLLLAGSRALTNGFELGLQLQAASGLMNMQIDSAHSLNVSTLSLALLACPRWARQAPLSLRTCGGPYLGIAVGSGSGFAEDRRGVLPRFGGVVRVDAALEVAFGWQLVAALSGSADVARGQFVYRQALLAPRRAYAPRAFALQCGLGVARTF